MNGMKFFKTWNKMSDAKKSSLALAFAMFFQRGLAMISTPIFTRIMKSEQYGEITNFTSWQAIIFIVATLNLTQGVFNNGMLEFRTDRDRFTASVVVLANLTTIIIFGVYYLFTPIFAPLLGISSPLMLMMLFYMLFYPSYSYWSCRQRYEYKYKMLTVLTLLISVAQVVFSIIAVLMVQPEQQGYAKLIASESILIIVGIIFFIRTFYKSKFQIKKEYMKYSFTFNIFLIPHFLAINVLASGDKVMINSMVGPSETAIYGVSYTAASVISIFWQAIEASWTPWLFEHLNAKNTKPIKKRANQIITFFAGISLLCMLFAPEIMYILASEEYLEGIYIIPSVTAGVFFTAVYALYMRIEYYSKKTKATMVGSIIVAIANIVLNYIFIQKFGYFAAGYTTLVCYIFLAVFHWWYSRKIGMKNVYNDKYIVILSVTMILTSLFITFTYTQIVLRYAIILMLLAVGCIFRQKLVCQIKQILK